MKKLRICLGKGVCMNQVGRNRSILAINGAVIVIVGDEGPKYLSGSSSKSTRNFKSNSKQNYEPYPSKNRRVKVRQNTD